tara:strand:+ start:3936 stop:4850 length:915 start_codon:yes stop_codon:yes gene_type:complete
MQLVSNKKPNFLIVGAPKAGTTSLYYYLMQHPDIIFPELKETKFFSSQVIPYPQNGPGDWSIDKFAIKSKAEYCSLFENLKYHKFRGEASPDYLVYAKKVSPIIKKTLGDIPIIISLRNPISRSFSAYSNMLRDNRESLNFLDALKIEKQRSKKGWDFMWKYAECSMYYNQVMSFKSQFSDVKIIFFEDLISDPLKSINSILSFLNLEKMDNLNQFSYNPSGIPINYFSKFILNRNNKLSIITREFLKFAVPRIWLEKVAKKSLRKLSITDEETKFLRNILIEDILNLQEFLKLDLINKWNINQ